MARQLETWKDKIQEVSFRGVVFTVKDDERAGGRRLEPHQYPGSNVPWTEDHGRKVRTFSLSGHLLSNDQQDYIERRDKLIEAFEADGDGDLIHQQYGLLRVGVDEYTISHSSTQRGQATIDVVFFEAGQQAQPALTNDTVAGVSTTGLSCLKSAEGSFAKVFSVKDQLDFVVDTAIEKVEQGLSAINKVNGRINSALQPVADLTQRVNSFGNELSTLIRTPVTFANTFSNLLSQTYGIADDVVAAFGSYRQLRDTFKIRSSFGTDTPSRVRQTTNDAALSDFMYLSNTVIAATVVAQQSAAIDIKSNVDSPFDSYEEAISIRDEIIKDLDTVAEFADIELFEVITDLRRSVAQHINSHGVRLPRIAQQTFRVNVPVMVAAYAMYGNKIDADIFNDVITRNKIPDPFSVPSNLTMEYLRA